MPIFAVFNIPGEDAPIARRIAEAGSDEPINYAAVDRLVGRRQKSGAWQGHFYLSQDWCAINARNQEHAIELAGYSPMLQKADIPQQILSNWEELSNEIANGSPEEPVGLNSLHRVLGLGYDA